MEDLEIQQFRQMLLTLLESQPRPFRRDEISIDRSSDEFDQVRDAIEREVIIRRLEVDSVRAREIQTALQRIQDGTYGACLQCGSDISFKRLRAVPWTPYCLFCQGLADQERKETASERSAVVVNTS